MYIRWEDRQYFIKKRDTQIGGDDILETVLKLTVGNAWSDGFNKIEVIVFYTFVKGIVPFTIQVNNIECMLFNSLFSDGVELHTDSSRSHHDLLQSLKEM